MYLAIKNIDEDSILIVKEDDRFKEECIFEVVLDDGSGDESTSKLEGTFIDALEFIKDNFKD